MNCPKCGSRLAWEDGAFCKFCMDIANEKTRQLQKAKKEAENEQTNPADPICGTCNGSREIPCPDGFAICRECWGR